MTAAFFMMIMNTLDTHTTLLHLSLIDGVGPATVDALLHTKYEHDSLTFLYSANRDDLVETCGLSRKTAHAIVAGLHDNSTLDRELALLEKYNCLWISMLDYRYPQMLRHIASAPIGLYVRGDLDALKSPAVAVVGSRDASPYGLRVVGALIPPLVQQGYCIISGGAQGIDTYAHKAALDAKGRTVVVCGSGLLRPYPRMNERLFDSIRQNGGAIVSPFALQTEPHPGNFPARNRIISGMAQGCLVVQAAAKSGSLITAQYALNQGRHVFSVPGPIDDPRSAGCNDLIKQGAQLIASADDLVTALGGYVSPQESNESKHVPTVTMAPLKQLIIDVCHRSSSFDELLEVTGLSLVQLQRELFDMQLEGLVTQTGAGLWEAI